jgi:hypothetical protein
MGIASRPESVACPWQIFKELRLSVDAGEATRSSLVVVLLAGQQLKNKRPGTLRSPGLILSDQV